MCARLSNDARQRHDILLIEVARFALNLRFQRSLLNGDLRH